MWCAQWPSFWMSPVSVTERQVTERQVSERLMTARPDDLREDLCSL